MGLFHLVKVGKSLSCPSGLGCGGPGTYVGVEALGGVRHRGEGGVLVGALGGPALAGHSQLGHGDGASISRTVTHLAVWRRQQGQGRTRQPSSR